MGSGSRTWRGHSPGRKVAVADRAVEERSPDNVQGSANGKPIDVAGNGPIFAGFLADPVSKPDPNYTDLDCSGDGRWWKSVYTMPDVALNHPGRWTWNRDLKKATFVKADSLPKDLADANYFYIMKGFFISDSEKDEGTGPNLAEASPSDSLTLTARVYNYSLVTTKEPVHVRFYGQLYCLSSSCNNGTCNKAGLCGNSFQIGSDQIIPSIAGFKADGNVPNWTTASVDFTPANFEATKSGNSYMVFWVVVWMRTRAAIWSLRCPTMD